MKAKLTEYYAAHESRQIDPGTSKKIVILSLVFSIGMIVYHVMPTNSFSNIIDNNAFFGFLNDFCEQLGFIGLSFFFFVSAFLLYYNLSFGNLRAKLTRRIKSLVVPYILWNFLMYFVNAYYRIGTDRFYLNVLISKYADPLWFVGALILLTAAAPACLLVLKNRYIGAGILILLLEVARRNWFGVADYFPAGLNVGRFLGYVPVYFAGAYFGVHCFSLANNTPPPKIWVPLAAGLLLIGSFLIQLPVVSHILVRIQIILFWLVLPSSLFAVKLKWWYQISFYTYATHVYILTWLKDHLRLVYQTNYDYITVGWVLVWRLALTAIAFGLILASAWLLIRFFPKIYQMLTGGRVPKPSDDGAEAA